MGDIEWETKKEVPSRTNNKKNSMYVHDLSAMVPKMEEGTEMMTFVKFKIVHGQWKYINSFNKITFPTSEAVHPSTPTKKATPTIQKPNTEEWDI